MARLFQCAILAVGVWGCSPAEAVVETSSVSAFQSSLERMRLSLNPDRSEAFQQALVTIMMKDVGDAYEQGGLAALSAALSVNTDPEAMLVQLAPIIGGKNANEVIEVADEMAAERLARQLIALESEITSLSAELTEIEASHSQSGAQLEGLQVRDARFRVKEGGFLREPVIDMTITNQAGRAIKRVFFRGILETPGRSVPWVNDTFNYSIPGGIENGESLPLSLAPNMFGEWGNDAHTDRTDLVLTVEVEDIEFADGTRVQMVTESDIQSRRDRLKQLQSQLEELTGGV